MSEDEWDSVVRVHLKGHFAPRHFAANYWREQTKSGREINAAIVNTTSTSGLFSNPGQANYDSAKSGIATLTQVMAKELVRYGVRANAIAPGARTRLTLSTPGLGDAIGEPDDGSFDQWSPANVSPFVAYLSTADCTITGETFVVRGGVVQRVQTWTLAEAIEQDDRWTVASWRDAAGELSSRLPLDEGAHGHPAVPPTCVTRRAARRLVWGTTRRAVVPGRKVGGSHVASRARRNEQTRPVPARERVRPCLRPSRAARRRRCSVRRRRSARSIRRRSEHGPRRPRPVTP